MTSITKMHGTMNIKKKRLYFPFSTAHRVSGSKTSSEDPSSLTLKATGMDIYSEIYDGCLRTASN